MNLWGFIKKYLMPWRPRFEDGQWCAPCWIEQTEPVELPAPPVEKMQQRYTWCLDAGHGRYTKGKRSPLFDVVILSRQNRLLEWEYNRDIVERIIIGLEDAGVDYMRTMPADGNYGNALALRVSNANTYSTELPKLFLSIHGNASTDDPDEWGEGTGIETWHHSRSMQGRDMAVIFLHFLLDATQAQNRGLRFKDQEEFYVLRKTSMPAVLTENLFFDNREDIIKMADPSVRQDIADAHVSAILFIEENGLERAAQQLWKQQ